MNKSVRKVYCLVVQKRIKTFDQYILSNVETYSTEQRAIDAAKYYESLSSDYQTIIIESVINSREGLIRYV
jgi:hypothetical protein